MLPHAVPGPLTDNSTPHLQNLLLEDPIMAHLIISAPIARLFSGTRKD